jgi:hypothetical protein
VGIKGGIIPSTLIKFIFGFWTMPRKSSKGIKTKKDTMADICCESLVLVEIDPIIANIEE